MKDKDIPIPEVEKEDDEALKKKDEPKKQASNPRAKQKGGKK